MKKKKVFISGPIQGMEHHQEYRSLIRHILLKYGYVPIDPWEREKIIYSARAEIKGAWWRNVPPPDFIKRDLEDISKCDMLVAYLPRISAGTCMELFYAKMKGKRTVTICELENPSPWIIFHSDVILGSIEDLEEFLKDRKYGKKES
ncbi:hypothetical protein CW702_02145 [Candidatus Bathyarchaeota archaeon]|nr:MAG: hypothetical protein CW702_02145 [Candidatus Bathyarchaeota archaeon]